MLQQNTFSLSIKIVIIFGLCFLSMTCFAQIKVQLAGDGTKPKNGGWGYGGVWLVGFCEGQGLLNPIYKGQS
jgi:hypothetical protein